MKKQITLTAVSLIALLLAGCKYPKRGESVNRGEIIGNFEVPACYSIGTYTNNSCIVRSVADFDSSASCTPGVINFDFSSFSVIGQTIKFGCSSRIVRELEINHELKQYLYTVKFKEVGVCKRLGMAFNLVTVPKIPSDYTVIFKVHKD